MLTYLGIGLVMAIILDVMIIQTQSSERLTLSEILACLIFWPLVVALVLLGILDETFKDK